MKKILLSKGMWTSDSEGLTIVLIKGSQIIWTLVFMEKYPSYFRMDKDNWTWGKRNVIISRNSSEVRKECFYYYSLEGFCKLADEIYQIDDFE